MSKTTTTVLQVDDRELATILAALRFHQTENLQGAGEIPDQFIREIATDGGRLSPLRCQEVDDLCERLNATEVARSGMGLVIEPPEKEAGDQPLFRVVYAVDVNAQSPRDAAEQVRQMMVDPGSLPPVLEVIGHRGNVLSIDLSEDKPA